jgi:hypothetical protein
VVSHHFEARTKYWYYNHRSCVKPTFFVQTFSFCLPEEVSAQDFDGFYTNVIRAQNVTHGYVLCKRTQDVHTKRNSEFPTVKTAPVRLHKTSPHPTTSPALAAVNTTMSPDLIVSLLFTVFQSRRLFFCELFYHLS